MAFARRSAIEWLGLPDAIDAIVANGGSADIFVGIDGRITSREALQSLLETKASCHIIHNPNAQHSIFHPKVFMLSGPATQFALIGSGNLTMGGLGTNYELGIVIRRSDDSPETPFVELHQYFKELGRKHSRRRILTADLLDELVKEHLVSTETSVVEPTYSVDTKTKGDSQRQRAAALFPPSQVASLKSVARSTKEVKDTMIQDVNPLNARIYFDGSMYVGGKAHMANPVYFAPYFTNASASRVPEVTGSGITLVSRVFAVVTVNTSDLKQDPHRITIDKGVTQNPQWRYWKRGMEAIAARARNEDFPRANDPHKLYFLLPPSKLDHSIKKGGWLPQIPWGYGTAFARLATARNIKELSL